MELIKVDGCTHDVMDIDGKCISKHTNEELRGILHYLADHLNIDDVNSIIIDITESYGKGEYGDRCETCGDSSYTSVLEV